MKKPYLIIVTGRPGAGKTTLAEKLSREWCLPMISRDRLKEGFVHTVGLPADRLPDDTNLTVTRTFFNTLHFLLDRNISVIAEAAFQHPVWESFLADLIPKACTVVVICRVDGQTALDRFLERGLRDESREHFHGDKGVKMVRQGLTPTVGSYNEPHLDCPTFHVDTANGYDPTPEELKKLIFG